MAYVVASSSRVVRTSKPHRKFPNPWRLALKALTGGLWIVCVGIVSVVTLLLGTGWLLAISTSARSAIRPGSTFSIPSTGLTLAALPAETLAFKEEAAAFADRFGYDTPIAEPMGRLAVAAPSATRGDPLTTGSIAPHTVKVSLISKPSETAIALTPRRADGDASAVPVPRTRPKLASLGPVTNLGVKPAAEPHPPRTAVYDITARLVYLPNGERLEAHSGLGEFMDNPSSSRLKMRGVTPPNTYTLTLRESLFHGVQALRMTPVDEDKMFGRAGILAHTYMLGPNGASNGCVSFKDYPRFLRAYLRGEIERIVVVPRLGRPPTFASQANTKA